MSKLFKAAMQNFAYLFQRAFVMLILAAAFGVGSLDAYAATPAAGTIIGNQASASYTDASNAPRAVTSNVVTAVVQQVASLTLDTSLSKSVVAGGQVVYPVTLVNTGNGTDTFSLTSLTSGVLGFTSVVFYADTDGNGIADNTTPITFSPALVQDGVFRFVAVGTVPAAAGNLTTNTLVITATSGFNTGISKFVADTTTVTTQAVINVSKSMSSSSGAPNTGPYTVTLSYTNTGNSAASNIVLTDSLPAGMEYVPGSGRWSSMGSTPLTEAGAVNTSSTGSTITYVGTTAPQRVVATVGSVPNGQSGFITFQVRVAIGQIAGLLNNVASYAYYDGVNTIAAVNTNAYGFTVSPVVAVSMTGATVTSATQGSTVIFYNVLTNNSNTTDSFDITVNSSSFPAGSSFALFQADGVTPMLDTNSGGIPDTGPVVPGAIYTVTLKVTLPTGAAGGPFTISKTATSKLDPSKSSTAVDTLSAIAANTVNLTNNASVFASPTTAGSGLFATLGETTPQVTNTVNPGATTRFDLFVNNTTSGVPDTYDLTATGLPAGWSVVFRNAATGVIISNSGVINGTGTLAVYAYVTVPASQAALPGGVPIVFTAKSPTSGAVDVLKDAVIVNTIRSVTLTPNNNGQVFPGGIVVYSHTLSNNGNVTETAGSISLSLTDTTATFSSIVYYDVNGNGVIDSTDPVVNGSTNLPSMTPGFSVGLLVKVTAPSGAPIGAINVTNLTATSSGNINGTPASAAAVVADTTNVIAGNLSLVKEQALDGLCNGGGTFVSTNISAGAIPGACIRYRITATNFGTADALNVVISDATPANTTYFDTPPASFLKVTASAGTIAKPANLVAGTVSATAAAPLAPNEVLVLIFSVKINN